MAVLKPFRAVRPVKEYASKVAALPYDVMSSQEAREMVKGNPWSFLHVDRAEIDLDPSVDIYSDQVYEKASENLKKLQEEQICIQEETPCYYIYRQIMNGRAQAGIVGCASIDDYLNNHVKKHELTRADKEADRIRHVDVCDANTGPIFLTFRTSEEISRIMKTWMEDHSPEYDFQAEDGICHTVWVIDRPEIIEKLEKIFGEIPDFYIADGHHRAASAVRVGQKRREANPGYDGTEEFNYFLAVAFPDEELKILDYNRVVHDLNGETQTGFLEKLKAAFEVERYEGGICHPPKKHTFGMYLNHQWYLLKVKEGVFDEEDPVDRLDVSILQNNVLTPILGIEDPRTSDRISFVGGIRGLQELEKMVDAGMAVAFAMYPTGLDDLMSIADTGAVMPPKSTWFEPKLRSGLFIHKLS
ncbi:MAG: DUF1015 family protein [Blautia sp.]|nr:DUF1015 family protein [Blautia sp.]MDY5031996.1 DUF1015 family protein [Blautia sp.]